MRWAACHDANSGAKTSDGLGEEGLLRGRKRRREHCLLIMN